MPWFQNKNEGANDMVVGDDLRGIGQKLEVDADPKIAEQAALVSPGTSAAACDPRW
jgi:hypothetical protein